MAETLKEGKWTIKMGEGNTIGIIKPLIPFNCIIDTDVGLIDLIRNDYRSPDIFNIGLLDSFKNKIDLVRYLYKRKVENPILLFMRDLNDIDTANDLYKQFMSREYESILRRSVNTGLYRMLNYFMLSEEVASMISYSNSLEELAISQDKLLKRIKKVNIQEIPYKCKNIDIFFFKDVEDKYFKASLPVLSSKNITILDYGYNFDEEDGSIITNNLTAAVEINRCRLNIINAYDAKKIG